MAAARATPNLRSWLLQAVAAPIPMETNLRAWAAGGHLAAVAAEKVLEVAALAAGAIMEASADRSAATWSTAVMATRAASADAAFLSFTRWP